jgi:integrase
MQNGSLMRSTRLGGDVWEYRWREPGAEGRRKHRRMIVGSVAEFPDATSALGAIAALRQEINTHDRRQHTRPITVGMLVDHYRERELEPDDIWKTYSTKVTYLGYLRKWIVPHWETYILPRVRAGEVELWLRHLPLARSSCAKIRNLMSVLFNHAIRHDLYDRNPIRLVRQSAKRRGVPEVLSIAEIQLLLNALGPRERTLVLLDVGTGLRMSELFALKWKDVDFSSRQISVVRSIVMQVTGPCKTEASQKPIPLDSYLAEALENWRLHAPYAGAEDWIFASPEAGGRRPYWGQSIMRNIIRPVARKLGISKRLGWHIFRHTYSTLLNSTGTDIKVVQELLRHASVRVTMDTYTQAVSPRKREAQSVVISLLRSIECPGG